MVEGGNNQLSKALDFANSKDAFYKERTTTLTFACFVCYQKTMYAKELKNDVCVG